ncbi:Aim25 protein [Martiniozyma asiatica (nom. inval.)]|nr:Aim25 protein [Martiniozyma asiatica]
MYRASGIRAVNLIKRYYAHGRRRIDPLNVRIEQPVYQPTPSIANASSISLPPMVNNHPFFTLLGQQTLLLERQIEYLNLFLSFEQGNKYKILASNGDQIGWAIERDFGISKAILRQIYRTHRPFVVDVMDMQGNVALTVKRGFSLINSHIRAILPLDEYSINSIDSRLFEEKENGMLLGETVQQWHLWRRKYNLFVPGVVQNNNSSNTPELTRGQINSMDNSQNNEIISLTQFACVNTPFLSWDFPMYDSQGQIVATISRNFSGVFREVLTDTGVYVVDFNGIGWLERSVMLANAISIDFDYFSRHSGVGGGGFMVFGGGE